MAKQATTTNEEVEAAADAANAQVNAEQSFEVSGPIVPPHDGYSTSAGTRITRAFSPKMLLPQGDAGRVWIAENVLSKPVGHNTLVGRIVGVINKAERRSNKWKDKEIPSVALHGIVQAEGLDGKTVTVSLLFLPMAFAEQVAIALEMGAESVQLDVDLGIQGTGKSIPYEWTVTSYLEGRAERALRAMSSHRQIGQPPSRPGHPLITN